MYRTHGDAQTALRQSGRMPSASVIIPCRNVAPWVAECMESVLAALPRDGEAIAVNDSSTDSTPSILRTFADRDPRVRVIESERRGLSAARNAGLEVCRGEFVFFVDADDLVSPGFFSEMVSLARETSAPFIYCAYADFSDASAPVARPLKGCYRFLRNREILEGFVSRIIGYSFDDVRKWYGGKPLFRDREMASVCRGLYRRETIGTLRFDEDVELYEDAVFNAEYALRCGTMASIDRPLYLIRSRDSGILRTTGRDPFRIAPNKLKLLAARERIDRASGGAAGRMFAATCVLSILEISSFAVRGKLPRKTALALAREYLSHKCARDALAAFPLSLRKPFLSFSVLMLRIFAA